MGAQPLGILEVLDDHRSGNDPGRCTPPYQTAWWWCLLGAQVKTVIVVFMGAKALRDFRNSEVGLVFCNKGLMYNLPVAAPVLEWIEPGATRSRDTALSV